jgi:hypothetical protein
MTRMLTTELPEKFLLHIHKEIDIDAPAVIVFESILEQLGSSHDLPTNGQPMPMKLELWPGGRWYRDLGDNTGHFWGHIQVIKPPTLLEITGPLFMSYPAISHVQYRLTEHGSGTRLTFIHRALGEIASEHREGASPGWDHRLERIRQQAERARTARR